MFMSEKQACLALEGAECAHCKDFSMKSQFAPSLFSRDVGCAFGWNAVDSSKKLDAPGMMHLQDSLQENTRDFLLSSEGF